MKMIATDMFGLPMFEGEAAMATITYRPYRDDESSSNHLRLRTPFFRVKLGEYGVVQYADTPLREKGLHLSMSLDFKGKPQPGEDFIQDLYTHKHSLLPFSYDDRETRAYALGKGKPLAPLEESSPTINELEAEEVQIESLAARYNATTRKVNPFIYHVEPSIGGWTPEAANKICEEMRAAMDPTYHQIMTVNGSYGGHLAILIVVTGSPIPPPKMSRGRDQGGYSYASVGRYNLGWAAKDAKRDAREAAGYVTSLSMVRLSTYRDIIKAAEEMDFKDLVGFDDPKHTRENFEKALDTYFKAVRGGESPSKHRKILEVIRRAYAPPSGGVHLASDPLINSVVQLGAGVPKSQVVKNVMDGFCFMSYLTLSGLNPMESQRVGTYGSMSEGMEQVLKRNIERTYRADKKPWCL